MSNLLGHVFFYRSLLLFYMLNIYNLDDSILRHGEAVDRTLLKSLLRMLADLQVQCTGTHGICSP